MNHEAKIYHNRCPACNDTYTLVRSVIYRDETTEIRLMVCGKCEATFYDICKNSQAKGRLVWTPIYKHWYFDLKLNKKN